MFPAEGAEDAGDCEVVDVVASNVFVGTGLPKTWLGLVEDDIGIEVTLKLKAKNLCLSC